MKMMGLLEKKPDVMAWSIDDVLTWLNISCQSLITENPSLP
jgi:hypothetical protein